MQLKTVPDRDSAVVVVGQAPMLALYLAKLKDRGIAVEFSEQIDERLIGIVRSHRRTVVVVGAGIDTGTKHLTILGQLQHAAAVLVSADAGAERTGAVALAPVLPWDDVAWLPVETNRKFVATAEGRVHFARRALEDSANREWLAHALMFLPNTIDDCAGLLGVSRASLIRRLRHLRVTCRTLCDDLVVAVCAHYARKGGAKESAVAEELGFESPSALTRFLKARGVAGWRGSASP